MRPELYLRRVRVSRKMLLCIFVSLSFVLVYHWFAVSTQASVAYAHGFVIGSDPVDGSTVATAPSSVRIFFDTPIGSASVAHVFDSNEHIVEASRSSISPTNPQELDTPLLPADRLPQGGYIVRWTALSNTDGHTTQGVIGFNIGHSSVGLPGEVTLGPTTSNTLPQLTLLGIVAVVWEWLVLMALTFWIGILVTERLILAGEERTTSLLAHTKRQARSLQWLCLLALLVGEVITLILRTTHLSQSLNSGSIDLLALRQVVLETLYGHLWLIRLALIVCALGFLWWTTHQTNQQNGNIASLRSSKQAGSRFRQLRQHVLQEPASNGNESSNQGGSAVTPTSTSAPPRQLRDTIVWLVLAGLIVGTLALSGDAAQVGQPHFSAVVLDWLHLATQSIWLGSLSYLGYIILPQLPIVGPDRQAETLLTLLRRFTPFVLATLGVLLVSGLFLSESSLTSVSQLFTEPYGRTLLVKLLLFAVMLVLSIYALFFLRPRLTRQSNLLPVVDAELPAKRTRQAALKQTERSLKWTLSLQSWLGAAVLLCAALMAFFAPPIVFPNVTYTQNPTVSPSATASVGIAQTQSIGDLSVSLQVLPGRVDFANTVIVTIMDKGGNPITDAQVQLSTNMEIMNMGVSQATVKGGNPTYVAMFDKNVAFSMFGLWDITLIIQRSGQAPVQAVFQVMVG